MALPAQLAAPGTRESDSALSRFLRRIDRRPVLMLPVWILAYFAVLWRPANRPLWFDELYTYYVSLAPTLERFIGSIREADLNPPLGYAFFRASIAIFGDTPFAARIPSLAAFLAAGLIVFHLISRRLGGTFGLAALGIFWSFSITAYAVEMRAYALILFFFCTAALCWSNAAKSPVRWTKWHTGLAFALAAMFLTHCFSPPYGAAIGVGELVRSYVARRIDKRMWAAILAPLLILPLYVPLVAHVRSLLTPHAFEATFLTIPKFYLWIFVPLLPVVGVLLLAWIVRGNRVSWHSFAQPHELAFSIAALFAPLITMGYCIWSKVPFWPRHGSGAILGGTLLLTGLLAVVTRRNSNIAAAAAGLILVLFCFTKAGTASLMTEYENVSTGYRSIHSELPFVTASGLTFLEMDHREAPEFKNRLYYLTDPKSSQQYHTTIFEDLPIHKKWFGVKANTEPYIDFTAHNRRFLVLGTAGFPEDWLLQRLQEDGAQIRLIENHNTGYRDRELYEVTLRGE